MPTLGVGGGKLLVAGHGQLILLVAGDDPGLRHQLAVLAHGQPGARLAVTRNGRGQVARANLQQALDLLAGALATIGLQENLPQPFVDPDRRIRGGIDAAGDATLNLPKRNLVCHQQRRLKARAAGLLQVIGRGFRGQARAEHTFAGQVEVARMLEHRTGHHLAQTLAMQVEALDQAIQCAGQHLLVARGGVDGIGAGERNTVATDNGDTARLGHG